MLSQRISGFTRELGKSQGYLGLPVRDEEIVDNATGLRTPCMTTAWEPTPEELRRLNAGGMVEIRVLGIAHPPILVGVGLPPQEMPE